MNCFECNQSAEITTRKAYRYEGVGLSDVFLLNAEVLSCPACGEESLMLSQVAKLHAAIGLAVAQQPAQLSGAEIKFLRRSAGISLRDWAECLSVAEGTYSKWENSHRHITPQADRLARLHYLNALPQKKAVEFDLADCLASVLSVSIAKRRDFAIVLEALKPEAEALYLDLDSPRLATPQMSLVQVQTFAVGLPAMTVINSARLVGTRANAFFILGESSDARESLAVAA